MDTPLSQPFAAVFPVVGVLLCGLSLVFAVLTALVARSKDRSMVGWGLLGLFLNLFAFFLLLCFPRRGEPFGTGNIIGVVIVGVVLLAIPFVVALIGMMAAIAVPNFLEAQTRAKVARGKSDLRNLAVALETYHIDRQAYPEADQYPAALTTPAAYAAEIPTDVYARPPRPYRYRPEQVRGQAGWVLWGVGPDQTDDGAAIEYNPTNGTTSSGDVIRWADRGP